MRLKFTIAALASASLFALASPAVAQDNGATTDAAQPGAAASTATVADQAAPSAADAAASGDIVVTASRRAERLQDVPIAVSALSGDQLAAGGFQQLTDIQYQFSGVQFGTSPNDSGFRLRGVGTAGGFSSSSEQNVGTVVDNVVIPFGNPVNSLGDLERVEVLKGPQGTQFGKNASSGVVNITTLKPSFDRLKGKVFGSYGELDEVNANASLNVPLAPNAALGVFAFYRRNDGFLKNVVRNEMWGGEESYGARAKLLFEPSDTLSFYLIGDYSQVHRKGPGQTWSVNTLPSFANPLMAARFGNFATLGITPGFKNDKTAEEYEAFSTDRNYGASLEANLSLGDYTLTSITAYRGLNEGFRPFAIDASSVPIFTSQQTGVDQSFLSQELRLTSPGGGALEYTAGIYASRRKVGDDNDFNRAQLRPAAPFQTFIVNISAGQSNSQTRSDSLAAFFDGKLRLADNLRAIGGIRYQYDWVHAESFSIVDPAFPPFFGPPTAGKVVPYAPRPLSTDNVKKGDYSGRIGLEYKPSDDLLFFGTLARGYLGPTVTFSGATGTKSKVGPQTVRDITIGAKTQFLDRRLTFNANLFFDKYKNLQTSVFNGVEFLTENAGGFTANGFEADASLRVTRQFTLTGSFTYSDTEFTDYITACPAPLKPGYTCFTQNGTSVVQAKGEPLSGAPKYSATFGGDFRVPISEGLQLDGAANGYYRSRVQYAVAQLGSSQPGYFTLGLNLGIGHPDGNWRIGVFARNAFDQRFHAAVINLPFADPGATVNWLTREGRRTIGVSAEMRF